MPKEAQKKDFILKHGAMIDGKYVAQNTKLSLTEAEVKEIKATATGKDLVEVTKTKTK